MALSQLPECDWHFQLVRQPEVHMSSLESSLRCSVFSSPCLEKEVKNTICSPAVQYFVTISCCKRNSMSSISVTANDGSSSFPLTVADPFHPTCPPQHHRSLLPWRCS
ncbi:hypothetical protein MHYP_G00225460 [Metynnis hypsauchen]